jgi:hypothetical protein
LSKYATTLRRRPSVQRIIEVALATSARSDHDIVALDGVIAAYASSNPEPVIPF